MADRLLGGPKAPELPLAPPLPPPPDADTSASARAANAAERARTGRNKLIIDPALPPTGGTTGVPDLTL
jgi:hypothetical protein